MRVRGAIDLAVAKTHKYASRESGDTVEVVERPAGGVSVVMVDGQGSGAAAKRLSMLVAGRAISLLSEGVRDGAAARASHDFLFALRGGRVSAALDIVSVDLASASVLVTRNSEVPMLLFDDGGFRVVDDSGGRIGLYRHTRPRVLDFPARVGLLAVVVTDGVAAAGSLGGRPIDLPAAADEVARQEVTAQGIADRLLETAIGCDQGRPRDDMTVVVVRLSDDAQPRPIRRLTVSMPLPE